MKTLFFRGVAVYLMALIGSISFGQESINLDNLQKRSVEAKQYFLNREYGATLDNNKGTKSLVFDFPGHSANELYKACLEILRGSTDKIELVKDRLIDTYSTILIQNINETGHSAKLSYNYMVTCQDGRIIIENPIISTCFQETNFNSGAVSNVFLSVSGYIDLMDEFSFKDKAGKLKVRRDELRSMLKVIMMSGHSEVVKRINLLTDSLLSRINEGRRLDSHEWTIDFISPTLHISNDNVTLSNGRNFLVIKTPYESSNEAKEKTQIFSNFINCDFAIEFSRNIIDDRYAFYALRNVPTFMVDSYFGTGLIDFTEFYSKYDYDDFRRFYAKKSINISNKVDIILQFEFEISYAPGLVRISVPKLLYSNYNAKTIQNIEVFLNDLYKLFFQYYSN